MQVPADYFTLLLVGTREAAFAAAFGDGAEAADGGDASANCQPSRSPNPVLIGVDEDGAAADFLTASGA